MSTFHIEKWKREQILRHGTNIYYSKIVLLKHNQIVLILNIFHPISTSNYWIPAVKKAFSRYFQTIPPSRSITPQKKDRAGNNYWDKRWQKLSARRQVTEGHRDWKKKRGFYLRGSRNTSWRRMCLRWAMRKSFFCWVLEVGTENCFHMVSLPPSLPSPTALLFPLLLPLPISLFLLLLQFLLLLILILSLDVRGPQAAL